MTSKLLSDCLDFVPDCRYYFAKCFQKLSCEIFDCLVLVAIEAELSIQEKSEWA